MLETRCPKKTEVDVVNFNKDPQVPHEHSFLSGPGHSPRSPDPSVGNTTKKERETTKESIRDVGREGTCDVDKCVVPRPP